MQPSEDTQVSSVASGTLTSEASTVLPSVGARSLVTGDRQESASLDARKYKENRSPGREAWASLYCSAFSTLEEYLPPPKAAIRSPCRRPSPAPSRSPLGPVGRSGPTVGPSKGCHLP